MKKVPKSSPVVKGIDMNKYSQQPQKSCAPLVLTKKFKKINILKYERISDLLDHVMAYATRIKGNDPTKAKIESMLVKTFGKTPTKEALIWYSMLDENYIIFFAELAQAFVKAHTEAHNVKNE